MTVSGEKHGFVRVRGAREHNLKEVDVDVPRDSLVVFTGVSGSGKSSLAFGTLYAEAQRRYLDSVSPQARRFIDQAGTPDVDSIEGLPPAVALQQQRGASNVRSSIGSLTTISNLMRMLFSRAGTYPAKQAMLYAEDFSPNTPQGACPDCHGLGQVFDVTERLMVPDDTLTIRERAIAAWPPAWHGQNLRDILVTLGHDVDTPWRRLPKRLRDWILYTEERPTVPVYAGFTPAETKAALRAKMEPSYQGTFVGVRRYVLQTFATTQSASMKKRVARFMTGAVCPQCAGKRLKPESLTVKFAGRDIAEMGAMTLAELADRLRTAAEPDVGKPSAGSQEKRVAAQRIASNILGRIDALQRLGLSYLSLDRSAPTLSPGELQRVRLATQIHSNLFGVVYVLDEPTAGLHPADSAALVTALDRLKAAGNSLFVVEHDQNLIRQADWVVDLGPGAGSLGGRLLYSGPLEGLRGIEESVTARWLYRTAPPARPASRKMEQWLQLSGVQVNNLHELAVAFPIGAMTTVTGVSGSGKSSLVSLALVQLVAACLGQTNTLEVEQDDEQDAQRRRARGRVVDGAQFLKRIVQVDQKPIGRTPRSNLATYTGLFDDVRKLFAATPAARKRGYGPGRFSFNVDGGRCATCEGEGFVFVELLFMPGVYAPCSTCHGARFNDATLKVSYRGMSIADVLAMTVDEACAFFADQPATKQRTVRQSMDQSVNQSMNQSALMRSLVLLRDIGVGYLRLGQPATELSGGEAQRIKLATELQRPQRGATLYVLDEPTTGLHPADVDKLMLQLRRLADAGNTVVIVEHDLGVIASSDWVIDIGPGAGSAGGTVVAAGTPETIARHAKASIAPYLAAA